MKATRGPGAVAVPRRDGRLIDRQQTRGSGRAGARRIAGEAHAEPLGTEPAGYETQRETTTGAGPGVGNGPPRAPRLSLENNPTARDLRKQASVNTDGSAAQDVARRCQEPSHGGQDARATGRPQSHPTRVRRVSIRRFPGFGRWPGRV